MRIAIVVNMVAPYTRPLFEQLSRRDECELLVVCETTMERDKHWRPEEDLPFENVLLDSWTLNLARLAVGSGFKTRFDTYLYVPKHPLAPLRRFAPDVVVAAGGGIWSSPANVAALLARSRRHWGFVPWWGSYRRDRPTWPRRIAGPWVKTFIRRSDAWIGYGTRQARDLVSLGADPERVVTAPITPVLPDGLVPRRRAPAGREPRYLFVGRFLEIKGLDDLLAAFGRLDSGELWLVGDGPLRGMLEEAARRQPRIRVFGYLEEEALRAVYDEADVFVLPSLYDAWGLVVHEALAHGLAVIATDRVGSVDDLVVDGVNGRIVPARDPAALADAMRDVGAWSEEQWVRVEAESRERLATISVERSVQGFLDGCSLALEHRRSARAR
jgi:glycosyltransferase involved in cell wall biosynthesis